MGDFQGPTVNLPKGESNIQHSASLCLKLLFGQLGREDLDVAGSK